MDNSNIRDQCSIAFSSSYVSLTGPIDALAIGQNYHSDQKEK